MIITREDKIIKIIEKIERSELSPSKYIQRYNVPFSIAQFYRYRAKFFQKGKEYLKDKRKDRKIRSIDSEEIAFLRGFISNKANVSPTEALRAVAEEFGTEVHRSTMSRILKKFGVLTAKSEVVKKEHVSCAGFELITALAIHLDWPSYTVQRLMDVVDHHRIEPQPDYRPDKDGRNVKGHFSKKYNQRSTVRKMKFASIEQKRIKKDLRQMDIFKTSSLNLERKCLALLALPLVTMNGEVRHVNAAFGNALSGFCGFNYKQATLDKFLRELKYLGVSESLLIGLVKFWFQKWKICDSELELPFLCFYIDGNTKPLWSKYRVKKNKVTMLGRVMGCLEQVFLHDSHGRPIYFETYSGHAPVGVYTLSMMDKIEEYLNDAIGNAQVCRVLVMDGASNSVETLRAFASQDQYHYITTLDDNQWSERKIRHIGEPERYNNGDATLYDCKIELKDSKETNYLIIVRAVRIEWDNGKNTILLTSLQSDTIGTSLVVKAYFDRWPFEELTFRSMKAFVSLHRVAGYGKQLVDDPEVQKKQEKLKASINDLKQILKEPMKEISQETVLLSDCISQERNIRNRGSIKDGKRIQSNDDLESLKTCVKEIGKIKRRIKKIEKKYEKEFNKLKRCEKNWLRLQGKEVVYKVDVELDQIITYFRVSLANISAYFLKEFLYMGQLSFKTLMQSVLLLDGEIEETSKYRRVVLKKNLKDTETMKKLETALVKFNALSLHTLSGKKYNFSLG
jgi:transposase